MSLKTNKEKQMNFLDMILGCPNQDTKLKENKIANNQERLSNSSAKNMVASNLDQSHNKTFDPQIFSENSVKLIEAYSQIIDQIDINDIEKGFELQKEEDFNKWKNKFMDENKGLLSLLGKAAKDEILDDQDNEEKNIKEESQLAHQQEIIPISFLQKMGQKHSEQQHSQRSEHNTQNIPQNIEQLDGSMQDKQNILAMFLGNIRMGKEPIKEENIEQSAIYDQWEYILDNNKSFTNAEYNFMAASCSTLKSIQQSIIYSGMQQENPLKGQDHFICAEDISRISDMKNSNAGSSNIFEESNNGSMAQIPRPKSSSLQANKKNNQTVSENANSPVFSQQQDIYAPSVPSVKYRGHQPPKKQTAKESSLHGKKASRFSIRIDENEETIQTVKKIMDVLTKSNIDYQLKINNINAQQWNFNQLKKQPKYNQHETACLKSGNRKSIRELKEGHQSKLKPIKLPNRNVVDCGNYNERKVQEPFQQENKKSQQKAQLAVKQKAIFQDVFERNELPAKKKNCLIHQQVVEVCVKTNPNNEINRLNQEMALLKTQLQRLELRSLVHEKQISYKKNCSSKKKIANQSFEEQEVTKSPQTHDCATITSKFNSDDDNMHTNQNEPEFNYAIANTYLSQIKIPQLPNLEASKQELNSFAKHICQLFKVKIVPSNLPFQILKYSNCILIYIDQTHTILWNFNGRFYFGGWKSDGQGVGQKVGKGFQSLEHKYIYQGCFKKGKRNGSGVMKTFNPNGQSIYVGNFVNGFKEGKGKQAQENGAIYIGQWKEGKKHGKGTLVTGCKEYFKGHFQMGVKNGFGQQQFANGDSYRGGYRNGKFDGKGCYKQKNGQVYEGDFVEGLKHGSGIWKSHDGQVYQGHYQNDMKHGYGYYKWPKGSSYEGHFRKDEIHGRGKVTYDNGRVAFLEFKRGVAQRIPKEIGEEPEIIDQAKEFRRRLNHKSIDFDNNSSLKHRSDSSEPKNQRKKQQIRALQRKGVSFVNTGKNVSNSKRKEILNIAKNDSIFRKIGAKIQTYGHPQKHGIAQHFRDFEV